VNFLLKSFVIAGAVLCSAQTVASSPKNYQFSYDKNDVTRYAKGVIESFARSGHRNINFGLLNMEAPQTSSAIDGKGRRFVMVLFSQKQSQRGFEVVFEVCNATLRSWVDLSPVIYSEVIDIKKAKVEFESMRGNPDAGYPKGCPIGY